MQQALDAYLESKASEWPCTHRIAEFTVGVTSTG